jgi:hypothetical protein
MSVFVDRYLGRTRAAEHLVEDWINKHDQAMVALDVEELVRECIDLAALCQHAWKSLWQILRREPNGKAIDDAENPLKEAIGKTLRIFQAVESMVAVAKGKGFTIPNAEALLAAVQRVREISDKIDCVYPQVNAALAEEAIAAFHRGECIPIEDLIREAQSGNLPPLAGGFAVLACRAKSSCIC